MNIKRGDIYWIGQSEYRPAVGHMQTPGRPGIVVSNDANNTCSLTCEIVYLTGQPKKDLPTHCTINSTGRPSIALCEQITTVSDEQIREYIGNCTEEEMEQIDRCLAISLGLPEPNNDQDMEPTYCTDEEREELTNTIKELESDLAVTTAKLEMMKELYDRLLQSTIR